MGTAWLSERREGARGGRTAWRGACPGRPVLFLWILLPFTLPLPLRPHPRAGLGQDVGRVLLWWTLQVLRAGDSPQPPARSF